MAVRPVMPFNKFISEASEVTEVKFVEAMLISAVPSNETPAIFLAVCKEVAVAALPVVEPELVAVVAVAALPVVF